MSNELKFIQKTVRARLTPKEALRVSKSKKIRFEKEFVRYMKTKEYLHLIKSRGNTLLSKYDTFEMIGIPDFFYFTENKEEPSFIEMKTKKDGLRYAQIKWIYKYHKRYKIKVINFDFDKETYKLIEYFKEQQSGFPTEIKVRQ